MNRKQITALEHLTREDEIDILHMTKVGDHYILCVISPLKELYEVTINGSGDWRRRKICDLKKKD